MPPEVFNVIDPLQTPLHLGKVKLGVIIIGLGCEIVTAVNKTQALASVTEAVYVPAHKPVNGFTVPGAGGANQETI